MARRCSKRSSSGKTSMDNNHFRTTSTSISSSIRPVLVFQHKFSEQPRTATSSHTCIIMPSCTLYKRRGLRSRDVSTANCIVQPGRPLSKAEREARKDSVMNSQQIRHENGPTRELQDSMPDGQHDWRWTPFPHRKDNAWTGHRTRLNVRDVVLLFIASLLIFGALYSVTEYLLSHSRASAQCIPSTVYLPITETETVTSIQYVPALSSSGVAPVTASTSPAVSYTTILTTTVPYTQTITVPASLAPSSAAAPLQSSGPPPLSYVVNSGTTSWLGASPSSGVSIVFASTVATVTIEPNAATELTSRMTITSTVVITRSTTITLSSSSATASVESAAAPSAAVSLQITPTATVPPLTTTVFNIVSPDSTTTLTRRLTTTISLSRVTPHFSFTGIKTNGWNNTSAVQYVQSAQPATRTFSELFYFGAGNATTSTSTALITTTIGATITQTFVPTPFVASISGSFTTLTGTPTTITYTVQAEPTTASISLPDVTSVAGQTPSTLPSGVDSSIAVPSGMSRATVLSSAQVSPSQFSYAPLLMSSAPSGLPVVSSMASPSYSNTSSSALSQADTTSAINIATSISEHGMTQVATSVPFGSASRSSPVSSSNLQSPTTRAVPGMMTEIVPSPPGYSVPSSSTEIPASDSATSNIAGGVAGSPTLPNVASEQTTSHAPSLKTSVTPGGISTFSHASSPSKTDGSSTASSSTHSAVVFPKSSTSFHSTNTSTSLSAAPTSSSSFSNPFPASPAIATPSGGCGEQGDFTMTFDDLPTYSHAKRQWNQTNSTDITHYAPLSLRPYHHLLFSGGYVYAPNPAEPYAPASSPNVAAFIDPNVLRSKPGSLPNMTEPGEIGEVPHGDDNSTFWFDPQSAYLGCDNDGTGDCTVETTGYQYNPQIRDEIPGPQTNFTVAPCIGFKNCKLQRVVFPDTFRNLSGVQFRAFVDNEPRMYFVDNLNMRWSNTSCEAGMQRQSSR